MKAPVPRVELTQAEAAEALGISVNTFKERVRPYVKHVDLGTRMLFPVSELERWLADNAHGLRLRRRRGAARLGVQAEPSERRSPWEMPPVTFYVTDAEYTELQARAADAGMKLRNYLHGELFALAPTDSGRT